PTLAAKRRLTNPRLAPTSQTTSPCSTQLSTTHETLRSRSPTKNIDRPTWSPKGTSARPPSTFAQASSLGGDAASSTNCELATVPHPEMNGYKRVIPATRLQRKLERAIINTLYGLSAGRAANDRAK